jgi:hypothetical protein
MKLGWSIIEFGITEWVKEQRRGMVCVKNCVVSSIEMYEYVRYVDKRLRVKYVQILYAEILIHSKEKNKSYSAVNFPTIQT